MTTEEYLLKRIEELEQQVEESKQQAEELEQQNKELEQQVKSREVRFAFETRDMPKHTYKVEFENGNIKVSKEDKDEKEN